LTIVLFAAVVILAGIGNVKISQLPSFSTFASTDLLSGVDVSDTSEAVTGTTKKMTLAQLYGSPANGNLIGWVNGVPTPIWTGDGLTLSSSPPYTLVAAGGGGGGGGGSGTVTSLSVTTANGLAGVVANPNTTPAITLGTTVTGLLKGNGTAISPAVSGADYQAPITLTTVGTGGPATLAGSTLNIPQYGGGSGSGTVNTGTAGTLGYYAASGTTLSPLTLGSNLSISGTTLNAGGGGGGSGTVTSVDLAVPSWMTVGGNPVTGAGTLAVTAAPGQAANRFVATPSGSTGGVALRTIVPADVPTMVASGGSHAPGITPDPPASAGTTRFLREDASWAVPAGGAGGAPGGTNGQMQYNDASGFGGTANLLINASGVPSLPPIADGAPITGALWASTTSGGLAYSRNGTYVNRLGGPVFAGDLFNAIANTTAATTLFGGGNTRYGFRTIPANTMKPGNSILILIHGYYSTTGTPTGAFSVNLGGTAVGGAGVPALTTGMANMPWYIQLIRLEVVGGGASGTIAASPAEGRFFTNVQTGSGSALIGFSAATPAVPVTIDWTSTQTVDVTWAWGTASPSNSLTCIAARIWIE